MSLPGGCNPADVLFKLAHLRGIKAPTFDQVLEQGPPHDKVFTWSCSFLNDEYKSVGHGKSKKEARNASAKLLIEQLDLESLPNNRKAFQQNRAQGAKRKNEEGGTVSAEGGATTSEGDASGPTPSKKSKKNKTGARGPPVGGGAGYSGFNTFGLGGGQQPLFQGGFDGPGVPSNGSGMIGGMGPMGFPVGMNSGMGFGGFNEGGFGQQEFEMGPSFGSPMFPRRQFKQRPQHFTVEDRYVMARHATIYPGQEELDTILSLVDVIEKALKKVSDLVGDSGTASDREILGVARVGDLAKGLLLTGDKEVQLVLMCKTKPTLKKLQEIADLLRPELNSAKKEDVKVEEGSSSEGTKDKFDIYMFPEEACFSVTTVEEESGEVPFQVRVCLTSTEHRQLKEGESEEEKTTELKEEAELLCKEKCLESLAELRHAKWFTVMASPLPSCVEIIRILRDMAQREAVWAPLGAWATELLVERALFSSGQPLSPGKSLLRVMETIASGMAMQDGNGLRDPCERSELDVMNSLSSGEREELTKSAQDAVRKIHFRKIHEVLGMERFPPKKKLTDNTGKAEGSKSEAEGSKSEAEGSKSEAQGSKSEAEGSKSEAEGVKSEVGDKSEVEINEVKGNF